MDLDQGTTRSGRHRRVVATVAVAAVALASFAMSGVAGGADDESSMITVSFEGKQSEGEGCAAADAMSMTKVTKPESYSFVVTVKTDLCTPIDAKAAAYAMPDNRAWPWPQTLVETKDVNLGPAGVTTVTFAKDCDPVQFDLFTGAAPAKIDPFGSHHGPLLFPHKDKFNTSGSAYQYWPLRSQCEEPTPTPTPSPTPTPGPTPTPTPGDVPVSVNPDTDDRPDGGPGGAAEDSTVDGAGQPPATVESVQATKVGAELTVAG